MDHRKNNKPIKIAGSVDRRITKGRQAEDLVAGEFAKRGFKILARDVRLSDGRERVDIVAQQDDQLYLIEVKNHFYSGTGFEKLLRKKQRSAYFKVALTLSKQLKGDVRDIFFCLVWVQQSTLQILECVKVV